VLACYTTTARGKEGVDAFVCDYYIQFSVEAVKVARKSGS
jgi:hypothetical protein